MANPSFLCPETPFAFPGRRYNQRPYRLTGYLQSVRPCGRPHQYSRRAKPATDLRIYDTALVRIVLSVLMLNVAALKDDRDKPPWMIVRAIAVG